MLKLCSSVLLVALIIPIVAQQSSPDGDRLHSQIQRIEAALPKISDRGAALFLEAKLYARVGDLPKALALLKEVVALDEGFDPSGSESLAPLRSNPEFQKLIEQVHQKHPPVHKARVAYTVQESDLFPEGLAYDPGRKSLLYGVNASAQDHSDHAVRRSLRFRAAGLQPAGSWRNQARSGRSQCMDCQ
jgi:hypothetical protein